MAILHVVVAERERKIRARHHVRPALFDSEGVSSAFLEDKMTFSHTASSARSMLTNAPSWVALCRCPTATQVAEQEIFGGFDEVPAGF